jgi:hypothetical protein
VDATVTHVVAAKDGTEKIQRARRIPTIQVVKASWLMECLWSLTRGDERQHRFPPSSAAATSSSLASSLPKSLVATPLQPPPPMSLPAVSHHHANYTLVLPLDPRMESTTSSSSSSSSDDDDDDDEDEEDFAASFENELLE